MASANLPSVSHCVVVSSCDAYSDLWPYFFHFFFKYWPTAPTPVYLISNELTYRDPRVVTIKVGPDQQWGTNTRNAISQIDSEFVTLLLDDFFFDAPYPEKDFLTALEQFQSVGGNLLEMRLHGDVGDKVGNTWFRRADDKNLYSGINSNLWRRETLLRIAQPGLNIWKCESLVRQSLREGEQNFFFLDPDAPKLISFTEGVRGRFWKKEGVAFLRKNGLEPDLAWRPFPPQGNDPFSKLIRSFYKRRMDRRSAVSRVKNTTEVLPLSIPN